MADFCLQRDLSDDNFQDRASRECHLQFRAQVRKLRLWNKAIITNQCIASEVQTHLTNFLRQQCLSCRSAASSDMFTATVGSWRVLGVSPCEPESSRGRQFPPARRAAQGLFTPGPVSGPASQSPLLLGCKEVAI